MAINITLNQIKAFHPCKRGWKTLLASLDKTEADDEPLSMLHILESNGIQDTLWCIRVNWFEHKSLYMQFVNNCVTRAKGYAADADAAAAYAAADAAYAAAYAVYAYADADADADADAAADAAAAYATAYAAAYADADADAERKLQYDDLKRLLLEHNNGHT